MQKTILSLALLVGSCGLAFAQAPADPIEKALLPAPRQMKEGATVIKWKADFTYETLKKGTNRLVCYDRSSDPGRAAYAVRCTSIANLERVAALDAAEKDGRADDLQKELDVLFNSQNKSHSKDATLIPATFLSVTVRLD